MPFDGSGNYSRNFPPGGWQGDAAASIKIKADRHDQHDIDIASALSNVLCKDGQSSPTADIKMNGKKLINLGAPVNGTDAVTKTYADSIRIFNSAISITGIDSNGTITFAGTQTPPPDASSRPLGLRFTQADLFFGVKPAGAEAGGNGLFTTLTRFVWNSQAAGTGDDLMELSDTGAMVLHTTSQTYTTGIQIHSYSPVTSHSGPSLGLYRNTAAYAGSLGAVRFWGKDASQASAQYAAIAALSSTTTTGAQDGALSLQISVAGSMSTRVGINKDQVTVTNLYADNPILIGPTIENNIFMKEVKDDTTSGPTVYLDRESASPAAQDYGAYIQLRGRSSTQQLRAFAGILARHTVVTNGAEDGEMLLRVIKNGAIANIISLNATNVIVYGPQTVTGSITCNGNILADNPGGYIKCSDGDVIAGPTSATGSNANPGIILDNSGCGYFKKSGTTAGNDHCFFMNNAAVTPATVGSIHSSGSTTTFATTSDENLKTFIGPYDPIKAIDIIRRDPVRDFNWNTDGTYAVGWGAQTSYGVSRDLASPPPETLKSDEQTADPNAPGYRPWMMDPAKRTPYLWAALSWALDQIDQLKADVAALKGTPA